MGGGHSASNIQRSVLNSVTQNIVDSAQKSASLSFLTQYVLLDCEKTAVFVATAWNKCRETSPLAWCDLLLNMSNNCKIQAVNMSQWIQTQMNSDQRLLTQTQIEASLLNQITSNLKAEYGIGTFSNDTTIKVQNLVDTTTTITNTSLQELLQNIESTQRVDVRGGSLQVANLLQVQDTVSEFLQNQEAFLSASQDVSNSISTDIKRQSQPLTTAFAVAFSIVGVIIVIVVCILVARKKKTVR